MSSKNINDRDALCMIPLISMQFHFSDLLLWNWIHCWKVLRSSCISMVLQKIWEGEYFLSCHLTFNIITPGHSTMSILETLVHTVEKTYRLQAVNGAESACWHLMLSSLHVSKKWCETDEEFTQYEHAVYLVC